MRKVEQSGTKLLSCRRQFENQESVAGMALPR
jgi:hypothetical protein